MKERTKRRREKEESGSKQDLKEFSCICILYIYIYIYTSRDFGLSSLTQLHAHVTLLCYVVLKNHRLHMFF